MEGQGSLTSIYCDTDSVFLDNFLIPSNDNIAWTSRRSLDVNNNNTNICRSRVRGSSQMDMNDENLQVDGTVDVEWIELKPCPGDVGDNLVEEGCSSDGSNDSYTYSTELLDAAQEAYKSKRLTPLLKHELKNLIQARRMSQGMDEMEVQFVAPTAAQMSAAEQEKAERRKSQNRLAARRFREKRKSSEESLLKNIKALEETNSQLQREAQQLRHEKQVLMEIVADHLLVCPSLNQMSLENIGGVSHP